MKTILYVDANINRETSRTERLAQVLIERLQDDAEIITLVLENEDLRPMTSEDINLRGEKCQSGDFSDATFEYAKQFASVDQVVFAAPYWDFSFPSMLKIYLERICAQGVTFNYSEEGVPTGLCMAQKAYYVTTSGGYIGDWDYGFDQISALCRLYFGIPEVKCFRAQGLDIITNDPEAIMQEAIAELKKAEL